MADSIHTTNPSATRRAVVAGIAAAPLMALPSVAVPLEPDPVFAALDAERKAHEVWALASDAYGEAEAGWFEVSDEFPSYIEIDHAGIFDGDPKGERPMLIDEKLCSHEDVDKHFERWSCWIDLKARIRPEREQQLRADYDARRAAAHEELRRRLGRHEAERDRRKVDELHTAERDALALWCDAERAVMAARPKTIAGALAQLAFARKYIDEGADSDDLLPMIEGLEAFVAAQGGAHV